MKLSRAASIAQAWIARLLSYSSARDPAPKDVVARTEDSYGEPEVVEAEDSAEVRLFGDVIPHMYAHWFLPGDAVSDVGFLHALDRIPKDKAVTVVINSLGGDVFAGTVIANAVRDRKANTRVTGIAASIASVILAAGKKASIATGATVMVHKPWSCACGNGSALRAEADVLDKVEEAMLDIYVAKSGKKYTRDQWRAALKGPDGADGSWWTGAEAVAAGVADTYEQPEEHPQADATALLAQRKVAAALYCSQLPKHLMEAATAESNKSPNAPTTEGPEAKPTARTTTRVPGVSYLN